MARMFGTDGVRGVAGSELTIELATKLGQAGAYVLTKEQEHQPTLIDGRNLFCRCKCDFCRSNADTCNCVSDEKT